MPYFWLEKDLLQYYNSRYRLKNEIEKIIENDDILNKIKSVTHADNLSVGWTKTNGFFCVFVDVKPELLKKYNDLIGYGEAELFKQLKKDHEYLVLTDDITGPTEPFYVEGKKSIKVNFSLYKQISQHNKNAERMVENFLNPPEDDIETLLRKLLEQAKNENIAEITRGLLNIFQKFEISEKEHANILVNIVANIFQQFKINKPEDLRYIPDLSKIPELIAKSDPTYFRNTLSEFHKNLQELKQLTDDDETKEEALHQLIEKHPWILDFKFLEYPVPESKKKLRIREHDAFIDLYFCKERFGTKHVTIVEFKKSSAKTTSPFFRVDKAVILSPVAYGLSQLMHYLIHEKSKPGTVKDGILVIGKRTDEADYFLDTFSNYLHNIRIVTYDDLYETSYNIIKALKNQNVDYIH